MLLFPPPTHILNIMNISMKWKTCVAVLEKLLTQT